MDSRARLRAWIDAHTDQRRFAAEIGVTEAYLSQILSARRTPRLPILGRIEDQTGIPIRGWLPIPHGKSAKATKAKRKSSRVSGGQSHAGIG